MYHFVEVLFMMLGVIGLNLFTDSMSNYSTLAQLIAKWNVSIGTPSVGAGFAISTSPQGMKIPGGSQAGRNIANTTHGFWGIRLKWNLGASATGMFSVADNGTGQLSVNVNGTGTISILRGATTLITSTLTIAPGSTHYFSMEFIIDNVTGLVNFYVDGVLYCTFSGNTRSTANNWVNQFLVSSGGGGGTEVWTNDCYVNDSLGTHNNGLEGDIQVKSFTVAGAGTAALFTRGGVNLGTNWQQLAKNLADATSFNFDAVVNDRDDFAMAAVAGGTLHGVRLWAWAQKDNVGSRQFALTENSSGTLDIGTAQGLTGPGYSWYTRDVSVDVATGLPWATLAALNAAFFGYKILV